MATIRKYTVTVITAVWSIHTKVEAEHVIMAGAYAGTAVIGHDSALMALAYFVVGTTHVIHCAHSKKDDK